MLIGGTLAMPIQFMDQLLKLTQFNTEMMMQWTKSFADSSKGNQIPKEIPS